MNDIKFMDRKNNLIIFDYQGTEYIYPLAPLEKVRMPEQLPEEIKQKITRVLENNFPKGGPHDSPKFFIRCTRHTMSF